MGRYKRKSDDPRTAKVERADGETFTVTPEVADALAQHDGWERVDRAASGDSTRAAVSKATAPLEQRIAELEAQAAEKDTRIAELEAQASGGNDPANPANKES